MSFPTVAIGQKIKASWGNLVAARFNEAHAHLAVAGAPDDATTGAPFVTWITLGNVTVPSWAVSCIYQAHLAGFVEITAAGNRYDLRLDIGTDQSPNVIRQEAVGGLNPVNQAHWSHRVTLTSTGSKSVTIKASRVSGTGQWRLGTTSRALVAFLFLDN